MKERGTGSGKVLEPVLELGMPKVQLGAAHEAIGADTYTLFDFKLFYIHTKWPYIELIFTMD